MFGSHLWKLGPKREAKGNDSTAPPSPGGGSGVCTGPDFEKEKEKSDTKDFFLSNKDCEQNNYYVKSYIAPKGFSHGKTKSQCQHTKHCKLHSCSPLTHRARSRAAHGYCPQAQSAWSSRQHDDSHRLSPWDAGKRGLRSAMASDRTGRWPNACPQS